MNISKFTKLAIITFAILTILNCKKDEDNKTTWINPNKYTSGPDADTFKFALFSLYDWTIVADSDWVTVNKTSGGPVNIDSITVFVKSNLVRPGRKARIMIEFPGANTSGNVLELTQNGIKDILKVVDNEEIRANSSAIIKTIEVHSNIEWKVEHNPSWASVGEPKKLEFIDTLGVWKYELDISISQNSKSFYRQDSLIIIGKEYTETQFNLSLYQDGNSSFKTDSLSLLDLYNSTGGDNWKDKWNLNEPVSKWNGVILDSVPIYKGKELRVVSIDLHDRGLKGKLSDGFFNLTYLKRLWLNDNDLTDIMTSSITNLISIEALRLENNNNLEGQIPSNIDLLANLISLSLFNTKFDGILPSSIGNISSLSFLDLSNNNMIGELPELLGENRELSILILKNNYFEGIIPNSYKNNLNWLNWNVTDMICPQKGTKFTNCSEF